MTSPITVETFIKNTSLEKVWEFWTEPRHITKWNNASPDWHSPRAENDVRVGGKFLTRMEAKDGSVGFDFTGTYTTVEEPKKLQYTMDDGRKVSVTFTEENSGVKVTETFDPETENSLEMQRAGWQSILENFKKYSEAI